MARSRSRSSLWTKAPAAQACFGGPLCGHSPALHPRRARVAHRSGSEILWVSSSAVSNGGLGPLWRRGRNRRFTSLQASQTESWANLSFPPRTVLSVELPSHVSDASTGAILVGVLQEERREDGLRVSVSYLGTPDKEIHVVAGSLINRKKYCLHFCTPADEVCSLEDDKLIHAQHFRAWQPRLYPGTHLTSRGKRALL